MSKIKNVNLLDARNVKEDLAKEISEIANVQFFIESDESQLLLKDCKKMNVVATIKVPKDMKVINYSGNLIINKEYLEGFSTAVFLLVSGSVTFKDDVNSELIEEKIYFMVVEGKVICPKKLAGSVQTKSKVNGQIFEYNTGYIFLKDKFKLTNNFLKDLPSKAKLSFNKLMILEPIDKNLFEEKIASIQILNKLVMNDECKSIVAKYIEDYYLLDKTILPKGAKYIDEDILINNSSIEKYASNILFVDGEVKIALEENVNVEKYIKTLYCNKVICNDKNYKNIKKVLGSNDIEVEIISGKLIENTGKLTFSKKMDQIEGKITIKNMGKLVFEKNIDINEFKEKVTSIINYGLIVVPEELMEIANSKLRENYGVIKSLEQKNKELKQDEEQAEKILYANLLQLKL